MHFKTIAFVDFETNGLFPDRYFATESVRFSPDPTVHLNELTKLLRQNSGAPKITEFSFLAVAMSDFMQSIRAMENKFRQVDGNASIQTAVQCTGHSKEVNPMLTEAEWNTYVLNRQKKPDIFVHPKETLLTKKTFGMEWNEIRVFLENLPKPACFVAQNGIAYDYRILYDAVQQLGASIPDGIYFVDSFLAFQKIERDQNARGNANSPALSRRLTAKRNRAQTVPPFTQAILYNDIIKSANVQFHHAVDDTAALAQICLAYGDDFVNYINSTAAELPF